MTHDSLPIEADASRKVRTRSVPSLVDASLVLIWAFLFRSIALASTAHSSPLFVNFTILSVGVFYVAFARTLIPWIAASILLGAGGLRLGLGWWSASCIAVSLSSIAFLAWHAIRGDRRAQPLLRMGIGLLIFITLAGRAHAAIIRMTPHVFDTHLAWLDLHIGEAVWRWTAARPLVSGFAALAYAVLPVAMALCLAYASPPQRNHLIRASTLAAALAMACYLLIPAVGPVHVNFGTATAARNCMPSLHLTWALLLWLNARGTSWKRCTLCFVGCTAFATLATGEHYLIDLVAAVPFSWMVQYLSGSRAARTNSHPKQAGS